MNPASAWDNSHGPGQRDRTGGWVTGGELGADGRPIRGSTSSEIHLGFIGNTVPTSRSAGGVWECA